MIIAYLLIGVFMLVLTGPSASGKTEVAKILIAKYNMKKMVTYTTRPMRVGEVEGIDYHFVTVEEFLKMKDNDEFVETTYYNFNYYGSRKVDVSSEKVVILDPNGLNSFYCVFKDQIISVFLETPLDVRIQRMIDRLDSSEMIERRLKNDKEIFKKDCYTRLNYVVNNHHIELDNLADCIYKIYKNATL